jgi:hypothetical protein
MKYMNFATYNKAIAQFMVRSLLVAAIGVSVGVFATPQHAFAETIRVVTELPSRVDSMYSVLNGYVENSSDTAVSVWFEYGRNGRFENSTYKATKRGSSEFAANVFRLDEGVVYSYRAVARRQSGGVTMYGQTQTFTITDQKLTSGQTSTTGSNTTNTSQTTTGSQTTTTNVPEPVAIGGAGNVVSTTDSLTLSGTAITGGAPATGWFEWGTTQSLGNKTNPQTLPLQTSAITVKETVSGLNSGTTYYYRFVVSNAKGIDEGVIMSADTKKSSGIFGGLIGGNTAQDDVVDSSDTTSGGVQTTQTITTSKPTSFGSNKNGAATYQTASALGWGSILQGQYFTIDEKGNIENNTDAFGFGERDGSSFFANVFNSSGSVNILPHSFFGWIMWVLVVYIGISQTRRIVKQRQKAKEEKNQREQEMDDIKKYQEAALKNKLPA